MQHKKHLSNMLMATAAAAGVWAVPAQAALVPITNASFTVGFPDPTYGAFAGGADGWTSINSSGRHQSQFYDANGGGSYANGGGGITQALATSWAAGTYTLVAHVQARNIPDTFTATLYNNATPLGSSFYTSVGGNDTSWHTLSLVVPVTSGDPNIGSPITIRYDFTGCEGYLDAVSLDFVVPEPNSAMLLGVGASALALRVRRRRADGSTGVGT